MKGQLGKHRFFGVCKPQIGASGCGGLTKESFRQRIKGLKCRLGGINDLVAEAQGAWETCTLGLGSWFQMSPTCASALKRRHIHFGYQ